MFDLPDLATLRQCNILCSAAYTVVFFSMAGRRAWYLYWGWGSASYCGALLMAALIGEPVPPMVQPLFDGILALSMALVLGGVRRFDGQRGIAPWMWSVIAATAIVPTVVTLIFGTAPIASVMWSLVGAGCALAFGMPLVRTHATDGTARPRRIAGAMLLIYVPIYLTGAIGALLPYDIGAHLAMVPFLADQLLFGAANLTLLWIPASQSQQRLRDMALRDPLTGAWNRGALSANAADLLVSGRVVLLVDVDRFKAINDGHGHSIGDRVLVAIAAALQQNVDNGFVARLGGDEFLVVTSADDPAAAARHLAVRASRGEPDLPPWTLSIGAARIEQGDRSIDAAIQRADLSMYRTKRAGRTPVAA